MAIEYEDIDLGEVSEVSKEEFDLAKLEAEGNVFVAICTADGRAGFNDIGTRKYYVNGQEATFTHYGSEVYVDLSVGDILKIYDTYDNWKNSELVVSDGGNSLWLDVIKCPPCAALLFWFSGNVYELNNTLKTLDFSECGLLNIHCEIPYNVTDFYIPYSKKSDQKLYT